MATSKGNSASAKLGEALIKNGSSSKSGSEDSNGASEDIGKELLLKSPMGKEPMRYKWPLKKGKGSLRRSEDKQDEAAEILETVRWVCEDAPEIKHSLDSSKVLDSYDVKSYASMSAICTAYNKAVDKLLAKERGTSKLERRWSKVTRPHLKHILQKCYNKSVVDPNELNNYEAFTPEVYGETSFELICQILDKLHPIGEENQFVDLGSGVGQVVLQVAALTNCKISLGIEKANTPAKYAEDMKRWFEFWMDFYGKTYSKFKLVHGDFLDQSHRSGILDSTIVFVNNFAFGPEVDQHLKDVFADLADGARIFSSKSFCALNFRITDRNLSDIGTIMHVSKMDPLKGSVSWTGKAVYYYLHVIDRAKLERYFQRNKKQDEDGKRRGHRGRKDNKEGNGQDNVDESSSGSREDSRASSVEKDISSINFSSVDQSSSGSLPHTPSSSKRNKWTGGSDEESVSSSPGYGGQVSGRRKKKRIASKRRMKGKKGLHKKRSLDNLNNTDDGFGDKVESAPTDSSTPPEPSSNSSRPVRAAVANAAAITEAQNEVQPKKRGRKPNPEGKRLAKNKKAVKGSGAVGGGSSKISGLDFLHKAMMDNIEASASDVSAPQGCVNERLNHQVPEQLVHEELPLSINVADDNCTQLPYQLQAHLERCKRQYLSFIRHMQDPVFKSKVESDIEREKKRNQELQKREKQLKAQIENLIGDSLGLLKCRLNELGIDAKSPPEFIEKAKGIVCNHHELQKGKTSLEDEIRELEAEQQKIVAAKELELYETMIKTGISANEARSIVKKQIENAVSGLHALGKANVGNDVKVAPFLNKLSDVTLTKCGSDQLPSSTQIRKRPRDQGTKQKDWPEKRHKPLPVPKEAEGTGISKDHWPQSSVIVEEKNPEIPPKKAADQGRPYEKPKDVPVPPPVEVRKLETFHPSRTGPNVQPRAFEACPNPQVPSPHNVPMHLPAPRGPMIPPPQLAHSGQPYSGSFRGLPVGSVSMPKMEDFGAALSNAARASAAPPPPTLPPQGGHGGESLVLPPHPDSRSHSSEQTAEDMSFASNKVNSTPRAEQFEDRLKTIIHSVLTGDGDQQGQQRKQPQQENKPLHVVPPKSPTSSHQGSSMKPMFSPVKKELPTHLPPPPIGVVASEAGSISSRQQQPQPVSSSASFPPGPDRGRSMSPGKRVSGQPVPPPPSSTGYFPRQSAGSGMPRSMTNPEMGGVGNDYHRQHRYDDEACGRDLSQMRAGPNPPLPGPPKVAHTSMTPRHSSVSIQPSTSSTGMARMSQVIEDSIRGHIEAASRPVGPGGDRPNSPTPPKGFEAEKDEVMIRRSNSEGYPMGPRGYPTINGKERRDFPSGGAPKMPPQQRRYGDPWGHHNMPPDAHGSTEGHRNYPDAYGQSGYDGRPSTSPSMQHPRKRMSINDHPQTHPAPLPPKKQHLDGGMPPADYSRNQGHPPNSRGQGFAVDNASDTNQKWQEEISTGFDRLVAYATEVDKRRKSGGSSTPEGFSKDNRSSSPKRPQSRTSPAGNASSGDYDRASALSMKFKRASGSFRDGLPQRHSLPSRSLSSMSRLAASSIPHDHDFLAQSGGDRTARQHLPGENLPEHHFKKRYFANQNKDLDDIPISKKPECLVMKKRPSLLGGARLPSSSASAAEEKSDQKAAPDTAKQSSTAEDNSSK